jgi:hypothetical protein
LEETAHPAPGRRYRAVVGYCALVAGPAKERPQTATHTSDVGTADSAGYWCRTARGTGVDSLGTGTTRAAKAEGLQVARIEIEITGKVVVFIREDGTVTETPLDKWMASRARTP